MQPSEAVTELLPCPFCGSAPVMSDPHGAFSRLAAVFCETCEIKGPLAATAVRAAAAWNTRAQSAQPEAPLMVTDEVVERALHARVPGGAEVWCFLPQKDAFTPSETARSVIRAALADGAAH